MTEREEFRVQIGGLTDPEGARAIARKLFESYNTKQNSALSHNEISPMMVDAYKAMQKGFNPSKADVDTYHRVLDRNHDGKVTLGDIEQLAIKYLVGDSQNQAFIDKPTSTYSTYKKETVTTTNTQSHYSPAVQQKLDVARRLFKKFDTDGSGTITEEEVGPLLNATYKNMGMDYQPTQQDIQEWMVMVDENGDGEVTLNEYEQMILQSLKKAGISIE